MRNRGPRNLLSVRPHLAVSFLIHLNVLPDYNSISGRVSVLVDDYMKYKVVKDDLNTGASS